MAASSDTTPVVDASRPRRPLRLRLADPGHRGGLDGGWWPRSGDLTAELADLDEQRPAAMASIVRAGISPRDWDTWPDGTAVTRGSRQMALFPHGDPHLILLVTSEPKVWRIAVVPLFFTLEQGESALLAAATNRRTQSTAELFARVRDNLATGPTPESANRHGAARRTVLPQLLAEVVRARDNERAETLAHPPGSHTLTIAAARRATLQALLDYAAAIESLSWPVPRRIQMEIRMHRINR